MPKFVGFPHPFQNFGRAINSPQRPLFYGPKVATQSAYQSSLLRHCYIVKVNSTFTVPCTECDTHLQGNNSYIWHGLTRNYIDLPATHTCIHKSNEPCIPVLNSPSAEYITALCPVFVSRPSEVMRLSWPGWPM